MPNKISQDTLVSSLTGAELVPLVQGGVNKTATVSQVAGVHPNYFFHGFAALQLSDDAKFYDISGVGNHGAFGANLSVANAWATADFISTIDPAGGATNSVIRIPSLNFDYANGEKLILWWLGRVTPEGADAALMGDGYGTTYPGIRIRAKSNGKLDAILSDATGQGFGGASTGVPFDGTTHSFALAFDGSVKKYGMWVDEAYEPVFSGNYSNFDNNNSRDTRNANTLNIGQSAPAAANQTDGIVSRTRALVILRLSASTAMPSVAALTGVFQQLRANPGRRILASAF